MLYEVITREWAKMNIMVTKLAAGDPNVLTDYVTYMESNQDEVLLSLLNIVEFANRYHFNIDDILQRFDIPSLIIKHKSPNNVYTRQIIEGHLARFNNELACYYLNKGGYKDGLNYRITSYNVCYTKLLRGNPDRQLRTVNWIDRIRACEHACLLFSQVCTLQITLMSSRNNFV